MGTKETVWHVYILECRDGTLYTGVTTDLVRRLEEHRSGKGAKYTRSRGVARMRYSEPRTSRSDAFKREAEIKKLSRNKKLALVWESVKYVQ